ncbi:MAG: hypothetical protein FJ280_00045 [Planctomycetes bacterium]|nr:hypothetical protein [Planctomycetota bacterium]
MGMGDKSLGLCSTCNNSFLCTRRNEILFPVHFCEQFDDAVPIPSRRKAPVAADAEAVLDVAMGLCCNCQSRGSCTLRDSPGGVWHCEEYC